MANINTGVNILEQDAIDMDFTNLTIIPTETGIKVSGSYEYVGETHNINQEFTHAPIPDNDVVNEWNLYFWETDHSWHLDIGAIKKPIEDPWAIVIVAFGWFSGKQCTIPCDSNIWHIKPLPKDHKNPRFGHGVTSDGSHYHTPPHGVKGGPTLVKGPSVKQ